MWSLCEYLGENKKRKKDVLDARQKYNYDNSIGFGVNDVTDMPFLYVYAVLSTLWLVISDYYRR